MYAGEPVLPPLCVDDSPAVIRTFGFMLVVFRFHITLHSYRCLSYSHANLRVKQPEYTSLSLGNV